MYVRLTKKLAEVMEGVDLSAYAEGDTIDLDDADARLLIRGDWAEPVAAQSKVQAIRRWFAAIAG